MEDFVTEYSENTEDSLIIVYNFSYLKLGKFLVKTIIEHNMVIMGGYVRDICILKLEKFKDIDIFCENKNNYKGFLNTIKNLGFKYTIDKNIINNVSSTVYTRTSRFINEVVNVSITGIHNIIFKETLIVKLDFVFCINDVGYKNWKNAGDCDFTCNLFTITEHGLDVRFNSNYLIQDEGSFPFLFYHNLTKNKKFYLSTRYIKNVSCLIKLKERATKLISEGWEMVYNPRTMFTIGLYSKLGNPEKNTCSICLEDYTQDTMLYKTKCRHTFCINCIGNFLNVSVSLPNCPCCRRYMVVDSFDIQTRHDELRELDRIARLFN